MSFPEIVKSIGDPAFQDLFPELSLASNLEDSASLSSYAFPLNYQEQNQELSAAVASACDYYPSRHISWGLEQYIDPNSNVPWTDKILLLSSHRSANEFFGEAAAFTHRVQSQTGSKKEALSLCLGSSGTPVMSYNKGPTTSFSHGLPTPVDMNMDYGIHNMDYCVRQVSGESRGDYQRPTGSGYYSRSGGGSGKSSKYSRTSKSTSNYGRDEGEEAEDSDFPSYIPSSSRTKSKTSGTPDFACWFFKLDPVKYADCMHVHGRSSDLKYAHLKSHFRDGTIPSGFDKNMSWDEVWTTLFPKIPPPNNKYYVINEMIISMLESASVKGDDVTRLLDTLWNHENREAAIAHIQSISRDHESPPSSVSGSGSRRNRQTIQTTFDRTPRTMSRGGFISPPSSSSSSNTTPATTSRPSHRYSNIPYDTDLDFTMEGPHMGFHPFGSAPPGAFEVGKVFIHDEQYNTLYYERELPTWVDFGTSYLTHQCTKSGRSEVIQIMSYDELQSEYQWHRVGSVGETCAFNLQFCSRIL